MRPVILTVSSGYFNCVLVLAPAWLILKYFNYT
ncbi:hypothetical protein JMJ77_0005433 [Colletotrichum scovillei]|uniref:Uncharacterized protein n=1 Tax=Colletotrichum scovillei TaxID=1209932 RepID=A0A9P7RK97_9PEZI|nr:hypothetical protein JMJ77_0005433 [Colletotrichum scovillei]KAG7076691.1 hypothetical protein JMJ76_0013951 [Colletotrichum scovillei]KAG7083785.1 hypothetical protein JMJ78_0009227 [Colletotrichum scovillei]